MDQEVQVQPAWSLNTLHERHPAEQHWVDSDAVPIDQETLLKLDLLAEFYVDAWHILERFGHGEVTFCSLYGIGNLGSNDVYVDHSGGQPAIFRLLCHDHQLTCPLNRHYHILELLSNPQQQKRKKQRNFGGQEGE